MITTKIKIRRGPLAALRQIQLDLGEMGVTTDTKELYVGVGGINHPVSVPKKSIIPIDWNNKENAVNYFIRTSGDGEISFDPSESMMGVGCFSVTGNGTWEILPALAAKNMFAVCSYFGIGGRIAIKGIAKFDVGCKFYDNSGTYIAPSVTSQNSFVVSANGTASFAMLEGYVKNEGIVANTMPVGSRLAMPFITISNNLGVAKFDYFDIYNLESLAFYS